MKFRNGLAALAFVLPLTAAAADGLELFYEEPLEGVYSQFWSGNVIGANETREILVYLQGDGKNGSFSGVLRVDCETPAWSRWIAEGGYLGVDRVPAEAIAEMRRRACG